jgi:5'-nucleotidase
MRPSKRFAFVPLAVLAAGAVGVTAIDADSGGHVGPLRILLTNDDGVTAGGAYFTTLRDALCDAGHEVTIVADSTDQSGNGTRFTTKRGATLSVETSTFTCGASTGTQYAVSTSIPANASPADAVMFGIKVVFADSPPDLVVSGMNPGGNFGNVSNHSGTIGAAITAVELGVPAIAMSIEFDAVDATKLAVPGDPRTVFAGAQAARPAAAGFVVDLIAQLQETQKDDQPLVPGNGALNVNWPITYDPAATNVVPPAGAAITSIGTGETVTIDYAPTATPGTYDIALGLCNLPSPCEPETRENADTTAIGNNLISISPLDGDWTTPKTAKSVAKRLGDLVAD